MKSSLIILTFNEIEGLKAVFDRIPLDNFDECLVIDYQSKDGTVEFLKEKGLRVIPQVKRGRGEAFRMGIELSAGEILVFFSPDGNEDPEDTVKLKEVIEKGYDMAIASRFLPESRNDESGKLFPLRAWGNQLFTLLANIIFGGKLSDSINGFRAVRKDKFKELKVDAEGFCIEYQMSIRAMKLKQKIKEIPTIEGERIGGKSTANSIPTGIKFLELIFREIKLGKNF